MPEQSWAAAVAAHDVLEFMLIFPALEERFRSKRRRRKKKQIKTNKLKLLWRVQRQIRLHTEWNWQQSGIRSKPNVHMWEFELFFFIFMFPFTSRALKSSRECAHHTITAHASVRELKSHKNANCGKDLAADYMRYVCSIQLNSFACDESELYNTLVCK